MKKQAIIISVLCLFLSIILYFFVFKNWNYPINHKEKKEIIAICQKATSIKLYSFDYLNKENNTGFKVQFDVKEGFISKNCLEDGINVTNEIISLTQNDTSHSMFNKTLSVNVDDINSSSPSAIRIIYDNKEIKATIQQCDYSLEALQSISTILTELVLHECDTINIEELAKLKKLKRLKISGGKCRLSDEDVEYLKSSIPGLELELS